MLIRAKWLLYTGCMPLEEKQQPALTINQWKEIYQLCCEYIRYCVHNDLPAQNLEFLLQAIYLWSFTPDVGQARTVFSRLRQQVGGNWFVERIGLCVPGQKKLRTFYVDVERSPKSNSQSASINRWRQQLTKSYRSGKNHPEELYHELDQLIQQEFEPPRYSSIDIAAQFGF